MGVKIPCTSPPWRVSRFSEARLAVSKLYEKFHRYNDAARSYQMYLGLRPDLPTDQRQYFENKVQKMRQMATGGQ